jgi:hypothetical protein
VVERSDRGGGWQAAIPVRPYLVLLIIAAAVSVTSSHLARQIAVADPDVATAFYSLTGGLEEYKEVPVSLYAIDLALLGREGTGSAAHRPAGVHAERASP